jgi:hypothetical protein
LLLAEQTQFVSRANNKERQCTEMPATSARNKGQEPLDQKWCSYDSSSPTAIHHTLNNLEKHDSAF